MQINAKLLKIFLKMYLADKGTFLEMKRFLMIHLDTDFNSKPIDKLVCIAFAKII